MTAELPRTLQIWGLNVKVALSSGSTEITDCVVIAQQSDCIANCKGGKLPIEGCPLNGQRIIDHWANSPGVVFLTSAVQIDQQLHDATCYPIDIKRILEIFRESENK
jgi:hypothetical protein